MADYLGQAKGAMEKALASFHADLARVRTGRASVAILDAVRVDYYGQMVPLNQVATLGVPEPRLITVSPWEPKIIPDIERAIEKANIGLSAVNDGKLIRIPIPPLTAERRKEFVKMVKQHGEDTRVSIRHARRETLDVVKETEKKGALTEDDSKKISAQVQKIHDEYIAKVDDAVAKKEKEILEG